MGKISDFNERNGQAISLGLKFVGIVVVIVVAFVVVREDVKSNCLRIDSNEQRINRLDEKSTETREKVIEMDVKLDMIIQANREQRLLLEQIRKEINEGRLR
jgi:hypothetical protein